MDHCEKAHLRFLKDCVLLELPYGMWKRGLFLASYIARSILNMFEIWSDKSGFAKLIFLLAESPADPYWDVGGYLQSGSCKV